MKITNKGHYFNGKPIPEYTIEINNIKIFLQEEEFKQLTEQLDNKLTEDYTKILEVNKIYQDKIKALRELQKKIMKFVYGEDDGGWGLVKKCKNFDQEAFDKLLEEIKTV